MEKPRGYKTFEESVEDLKKLICFIHKTNNKIDGLVSFKIKNNKVIMDFICSMKLRKGVGKKLISKLIDYAKRRNIKAIYSSVSSKDKRVINFYSSLGFKKYGKSYYETGLLLYKLKLDLN